MNPYEEWIRLRFGGEAAGMNAVFPLSDETKHLGKSEHDVVHRWNDTWCNEPGSCDRAVDNPEDSNCKKCLAAAAEYGFRAVVKLAENK